MLIYHRVVSSSRPLDWSVVDLLSLVVHCLVSVVALHPHKVNHVANQYAPVVSGVAWSVGWLSASLSGKSWQCPQLTLDVKVAPLVAEHPALIQRLASQSSRSSSPFLRAISQSSATSPLISVHQGSIVETAVLTASNRWLYPLRSSRQTDRARPTRFPRYGRCAPTRTSATLCFGSVRALSGLRVYAWKEISVVNQILSSSSPQNYSVGIMNPAVSFDIDKQQRFLIVDDKNGLRTDLSI